MLNFEFRAPTEFIFGDDAQKCVGDKIAAIGKKKVLLHYGGQSAKKSGLLDEIIQNLKASNLELFELGGVQPNPRDTLVYEGISLCREKDIDFILAVGGGSTIDSAKAIAIGVPYEGDFWDFYSGKAEPKECMSLGVVLTLPAAGSEGSNGSVITKVDGQFKRSCDNDIIRPRFAFMNPTLTFTLPAYQTACGVADIMAHVFERYFTPTEGVSVTDRLCEAVLLTMIENAPVVLEKPDDYDARSNIMWAGMIAHNNVCGVGREQDWGSHMIEHELSALYDVAHGAGLAVIFPAWMRYQYKHDVMRFAQLAVRVWGCSMDFKNPERTALEGINRLESFFRSLGLPTTFAELGAKEEDIREMTYKIAMDDDKGLGNFHPLSRSDIEEVYKLACK